MHWLHCEQPAQKLTSKHAVAELSLSAMQAKKALKGRASAMYLLVTMSDGTDSVTALAGDSTASAQQNTADLMPDSDLQEIKHEYAERLPGPVPHGLPPERDVAHTTSTGVGRIPPF